MGLFKRSLPILVDGFAIAPEEIKHIVEKAHGVKNVSRIRSRWIGNTRAVDLVIAVDSTLSTHDSHTIADEVESLLAEHFEATDVSIHVEPDIQAVNL